MIEDHASQKLLCNRQIGFKKLLPWQVRLSSCDKIFSNSNFNLDILQLLYSDSQNLSVAWRGYLEGFEQIA